MYSIYLIIQVCIVKHSNKRAIAKMGHYEFFINNFSFSGSV